MHPELEKLIELALANGDLSEKSRAVILRKAETLGEDKDEIELVIDGKLAQIQKQPAPASQKYGTLKKCIACGASATAFATTCTDCGHEFSNVQAASSIQQLFKLLDEAESQRKNKNFLNDLGGVFSKAMGGGLDAIDNKKKGIINTFPVPNTKEDILEFLALATPNAKKLGNLFTSGAFNTPANHRNKLHNEFYSVWHAKCEQIIIKAKFSMKDDKKTLGDVLQYAEELGIK